MQILAVSVNWQYKLIIINWYNDTKPIQYQFWNDWSPNQSVSKYTPGGVDLRWVCIGRFSVHSGECGENEVLIFNTPRFWFIPLFGVLFRFWDLKTLGLTYFGPIPSHHDSFRRWTPFSNTLGHRVEFNHLTNPSGIFGQSFPTFESETQFPPCHRGDYLNNSKMVLRTCVI